MSRLIRRGTQAVVLVTLLLGFTVGARAHGGDANLLHACVKKANGQLRLVAPDTRCLPSEHAVDWSRNGGADARSAFFEVRDAGGTVVGPVVGFQGLFPVVGFKVDGAAFIVFLVNGALYGTGMVYFESTDCSPPGYIPHTSGALAGSGVGPSGQVYVEDRAAADVPISVQSAAFGGQCSRTGGPGAAPQATLATTLGPGPYQVR